MYRIAKDIVAERFGPQKDTRRDMLGSFIRHGLTQWEGESEILVQMFVLKLRQIVFKNQPKLLTCT